MINNTNLKMLQVKRWAAISVGRIARQGLAHILYQEEQVPSMFSCDGAAK
ncbi:MAG: hypothetical protein K9H16_06775 [Bacteroidales bacterium]|nr:hypothetical protein [Bacteroidales bacterium]